MLAPAFEAASISMRPASIVLRSATMGMSGNSARSWRTASRPSLLMSGVPASSQSAPPSTASRATRMAWPRLTKSSATWRTTSSSVDGVTAFGCS